MITATSITLVIDVPAAAAADIASRCPDAPIFERIHYTGGPVWMTPDDAREIEAEADYYCDKDGPGQSLTPPKAQLPDPAGPGTSRTRNAGGRIMIGFNVICEDDVRRHELPFATHQEAEHFAHCGHACTTRHDIELVDSETGEPWDVVA